MIDRYSPEKIYLQISHAISSDIQEGFEPGDAYLSEKALIDKFGVNRHTIRRAVDELVKLGLLEKRHGLGTFVTEKRLAYCVKGHQRLSEALTANQLEIETVLLNKALITARGAIAENLQLKHETEVIQVDTLRKVEGQAIAIISHFLPKEVCPQVMDNYETGSLGDFLKSECAVQSKRVSSQISATIPNSNDSFRLGLNSVQPILKVKTINEDIASGKRVEYSVTRFRSDMIQLEVDLNP